MLQSSLIPIVLLVLFNVGRCLEKCSFLYAEKEGLETMLALELSPQGKNPR